jgi:hypothetical protein
MKLLDLYYALKPAIPQSLRLFVRGRVSSRRRRVNADVWPIRPDSARTPESWPGWPQSKQFAFVLTHDVEGQRGVDRCKAVADLEMGTGFRSSFNFIPEGEYRTPPELRAWLAERGFEVGVHDLHHDGKLYRSRDEFSNSARRINEYVRQWGAAGFRSGFMLHNLEWLKELDVLYDASTFDTDPFEPQPDGVNTIFPFWVQKPGEDGFVELPYTLPQDSTLFLVLGETSNEIWKRKLEWIARNGGMALVNVHPDYLNFQERRTPTEFPARLYRDFLAHVDSEYRGSAWTPLPRELARFVRNNAQCRIMEARQEMSLHNF